MAVRAPEVARDAIFDHDVDALSVNFPVVDDVVNEFVANTLWLGYDIPQILIEPDGTVYTVLLDYPPLGADGIQLFQLTYHATRPASSIQ